MNRDEQRLRKAISDRAKDKRQLRTRRQYREAVPDTLSNCLKQYFKSEPESVRQLEESQLIISWPRIVGEAVAQVTEALRVRDGRLFVVVHDPLWRQELVFQKNILLQRLRAEFPKSKVRDIFFTA